MNVRGLTAISFLVLLMFPVCACRAQSGKVGADVTYAKITVADEQVVSGNSDPSIDYDPDGRTGWLVYSSIQGSDPPAGPFMHTKLAKSGDHGKSWTSVQTINQSTASTLTPADGPPLPGVWRYKSPSLVHDPDDAGRAWKLFSHRYFWSKTKGQMPTYGWIAMRTATKPDGAWSDQVALFGAGNSPPKPYDITQCNLNALDPALKDVLVYSEPGAFVTGGVLYLALTAIKKDGVDRIVLLASSDHGKTWRYVGAPATREDAKAMGYTGLDAPAIAEDMNRIFLLMTSGDRKVRHNGTLIVEFEDLAKGKLKRSGGKLVVFKHIPLQAKIASDRGGGQSAYHRYNTRGGLVFAQMHMGAAPEIFQIFQTGRRIVDAADKKPAK